MNKQRFVNILEDSDAFAKADLDQIEDLQKEYPYSQVIHIVSAISSYKLKSKNAKEQLGRAAVYSTDRILLKEIMLQADRASQVPTKTIIDRSEARSLEKTMARPKKIRKKVIVDKHPGHPGDLTEAEVDALRKELLSNLDKLVDIKASFFEEDLTDKKKALRDLEQTTQVLESEKTLGTGPHPGGTATLPDPPAPSIESKANLKVSKGLRPPTKENSNPGGEPPGHIHDQDSSNSENAFPSGKPARTSIQEQQEIIEKFINKGLAIKKKKDVAIRDENLPDLAQSSVELNDELVSENLARILLKQGKPDKAIDIYKKLIWKFPQKRAYFASQIESIRGK